MPRPGHPALPGSPRPGCAGQPQAITSPAVAARLRQLAAQGEHRRAVAEFRARRAADQQARINALLLEAIAALASLLGTPQPARPASAGCPAAAVLRSARPGITPSRSCQARVTASVRYPDSY